MWHSCATRSWARLKTTSNFVLKCRILCRWGYSCHGCFRPPRSLFLPNPPPPAGPAAVRGRIPEAPRPRSPQNGEGAAGPYPWSYRRRSWQGAWGGGGRSKTKEISMKNIGEKVLITNRIIWSGVRSLLVLLLGLHFDSKKTGFLDTSSIYFDIYFDSSYGVLPKQGNPSTLWPPPPQEEWSGVKLKKLAKARMTGQSAPGYPFEHWLDYGTDSKLEVWWGMIV